MTRRLKMQEKLDLLASRIYQPLLVIHEQPAYSLKKVT